MFAKLRSRLTYANVTATIALFLALGGTVTLAATSSCTGGVPCVNSDDIINGEVKTPDIGTTAVTAPKLATNAVTNPKIINGGVTTDKLTNGAVTTAKLGADAVASGKVLDDSLTGADINESSLGKVPSASDSDKFAGQSPNSYLKNGDPAGGASLGGDLTGTYPYPTIGEGKVTSSHIFDGTIGPIDLADGAVTTAKFDSAAVAPDADKLGGTAASSYLKSGDAAGGDLTGTYPSPSIANGAVTPAKFGTIPAARARVTVPVQAAFGDGTPLALYFQGEDFDTDGLHDCAGCGPDPDRLKAPISGVYQVSAGVTWDPNPTATRILQLGVNGNGGFARSQIEANSTFGHGTDQVVSDLLKLSAGDYVQAFVRQFSGTSVTVAAEDTFLAMTWIGPG